MNTAIRIHKVIILSTCMLAPLLANASYLEPGLHQYVGLEGYYYRYNETSYMRFKGQMLGMYYTAEFQPDNKSFRFLAEGRAAFGYKINYSAPSAGSIKNVRHRVFEGRLLGSYCMSFENQSVIEGYTGVGIRNLITSPSKTPATNGSYLIWWRQAEYNYIPIGIRAIRELSTGTQWVAHLEYDWFLKGQQDSHGNNLKIKSRQSHGYGARTGIDFHIPSSTGNFSYTLGAFARYWNIKKSTINQGYLEPKNNTQEYGVRLGLLF